MLDQLVEQIKAHPILEQRFSEEEDHTLIGILNVVATLSRENSDYCAAAGTGSDLVREVFHTCLFDIPTVRDGCFLFFLCYYYWNWHFSNNRGDCFALWILLSGLRAFMVVAHAPTHTHPLTHSLTQTHS